MANFLGPDPLQSTFFIPGTNTPGNGVLLFIYVAGSTTKTTVCKTQAGTAHTNPIVLNSGGNLPSQSSLWIPEGVTIKAVYAPSNDSDPPASPYLTIDNISGINDVTETASQWVTGPTPTFVSGTSLTLVGDQTATLQVGRRIQTQNTGGTVYSTISSSVFASTTALGVRNDSGALDSGLASLSYGLLSATNPAVPLLTDFYAAVRSSTNPAAMLNYSLAAVSSTITETILPYSFKPGSQNRGADLVASSVVNASTATGDFVDITGTTSIGSITTYDGQVFKARFTSTTALLNSTSLVLPGRSNMSTQAGDIAEFRGVSSGATVMSGWLPANGASRGGWDFLAVTTAVSSLTIDFAIQPYVQYYDSFALDLANIVPASSGPFLALRGSTSNAANFLAGTEYFHVRVANATNATTTPAGGGAASASELGIAQSIGNGGGNQSISGSIQIHRRAGQRFMANWQTLHADPSGNVIQTTGGGLIGLNDINGLRLLMSSGSTHAGVVRLYGLRGY